MSAGSCLVLLSLGHFASILRDSGLIEWLPHHLEQLGGPGSCKTPAATPMTSRGYLCRGPSGRLLLLLATAALEADTPPLCLDPLGSHILGGGGLVPLRGALPGKRAPSPLIYSLGEKLTLLRDGQGGRASFLGSFPLHQSCFQLCSP